MGVNSAGIPSPITSEDSGLFSIGMEGVHPLSSSPIDSDEVNTLTEGTLSKYNHQPNESISTSMLANKCSPSSICSSLRKRLNEEDTESVGSRDTWNDEMVPLSKTPRLINGEKYTVKDNSFMTTFTGGNSSFLNGKLNLSQTSVEVCARARSPELSLPYVIITVHCPSVVGGAEPSPLALVEKRSRSRRCLRFVSPGSSTCPRQNSRRPASLSCPGLKDGRHGNFPRKFEINYFDPR